MQNANEQDISGKDEIDTGQHKEKEEKNYKEDKMTEQDKQTQGLL